MKNMRIIGIVILSFLPLLVQATVYVSQAPNGTLIYTDVYMPGSKVLNTSRNPINNYDGNGSEQNTQAITQASKIVNINSNVTSVTEADKVNYTLSIISPNDQATFHNQDPIAVMVSIKPSLQNKDKVQLLIDAAPYGTSQADPNFMVSGLERGPHTIQARIVNAEGAATNVSIPITIFKQQASILNNNQK